jgi:hypothetical protein
VTAPAGRSQILSTVRPLTVITVGRNNDGLLRRLNVVLSRHRESGGLRRSLSSGRALRGPVGLNPPYELPIEPVDGSPTKRPEPSMTVDSPPRVLPSSGAPLVRSGRFCPPLTRVDGTELHKTDVGASSSVWQADNPSTNGSTRIRSWDTQ